MAHPGPVTDQPEHPHPREVANDDHRWESLPPRVSPDDYVESQPTDTPLIPDPDPGAEIVRWGWAP